MRKKGRGDEEREAAELTDAGGEWQELKKPVRRAFPGPAGVDTPLRVGELVAAVDDQGRALGRFFLLILVVVLGVVALHIGATLLDVAKTRYSPPKLREYSRVPVRIGEETAFLGVQVVDTRVPPELDPLRQLAEAAVAAEAARAGTDTETPPAPDEEALGGGGCCDDR